MERTLSKLSNVSVSRFSAVLLLIVIATAILFIKANIFSPSFSFENDDDVGLGFGGSVIGAEEHNMYSGKFDVNNFDLQSRAAVVLHEDSGDILIAHNAFTPYPVASLTKFMSALVALESGIDLEEPVVVSSEDWTIGGTLRIVPDRDMITIRDLVYASITGSANNAANRLARCTGIDDETFVRAMNKKAISFGLEHTQFADPSGLSPENIASAYDIAIISLHALSGQEIIRDAAARAEYDIHILESDKIHTIKNPNNLCERARDRFIESKTGYLHEALYNLALTRETPTGRIIAVTLGHPDKTGGEDETLMLLDVAEEKLSF